MATATPARTQRSKKDRHKKPNLVKLYRRRTDPLDLSTQEFRAHLLRKDAKTGKVINIDGVIESIDWRYEPGNPSMMGTLVCHKSALGRALNMHDGHVLRLQVRWGGKWRELWRMRLYDGQTTLQDVITWDLADDLTILQSSVDHWHFTKSKKHGHPKGWLVHEIVREVARRYRIPLGKIAKGKHYITDLSGKFTPLQVLQKAYAIEKQATGHRFVMQWRNGKLNVTPLRRNPLMYILRDAIEDAAIGKEPRDEKFATAVTVRATLKGKKGSRKREKLVVSWVNEKAVAKEGFIHKEVSGGNVKDRDDALTKAKRYIATHSVRKRTLTGVTHPGIAFLRRGDAIRVSMAEHGFSGPRSVCFITAGSWRLAGGDFTMSLDLTFDDPYVTPKARRKAKDKKTRKDKQT